MKNHNAHKVQELANDYLRESNIEEHSVTSKEGHKVLVIHLLTDFYKFLKK